MTSLRTAITPLACVAFLMLASVAVASTFDNHRAPDLAPGPITAVGAGGELLDEGNPGIPVISIPAAVMGLVAGDDITALSMGDDFVIIGEHLLVFSVDENADGKALSGVAAEKAKPDEACGDIFTQTPAPGCSNVVAPPGRGYTTVGAGGQEANATWAVPNPPGGPVDDTDAFDYTDGTNPPMGVWFTLAPGSPSLLVGPGFTSADILYSPLNGTFGLATLQGVGPADFINLGLSASSHIDALNIKGDQNGTILAGAVGTTGCDTGVVSTHYLQFSLAPGDVILATITSPTFAPATATEGDVLVRTAPGGVPTPVIFNEAEKLGLNTVRSGDNNDANLNALEAVTVIGDPIPTVSEWGVAVIALLVLSAGTVVLRRRRNLTAAA